MKHQERTQMNLLIINEDAVYIKKKIGSKFPELTIHAAADESEVGNFVEKADILLATSERRLCSLPPEGFMARRCPSWRFS
jgi:hypothetical protein